MALKRTMPAAVISVADRSGSVRALLTCAGLCLATIASPAAHGRDAELERALSEVRGVKADMFSTESSVLGKLPSPAELAAVQLACRPIPRPAATAGAGRSRTVTFDAATRRRLAKELAPMPSKGTRRANTTIPLGITGAQVTERMGRKAFFVVHVLPKTAADGVLRKGDVIIGANGRFFRDEEDPRPEMGYALAESQSPEFGGILVLQIARDGKPMNVKLDLGSRLYYSETWPFECKKSRQIAEAAVPCVLTHCGHRYDFWTPLFLMASGDDAALERARRYVYKYSAPRADYDGELKGASSWTTSYHLISLCEYYQLTGDSSVLPEIGYKVRILEHNQYPSGGWSHGAGGGYGEINNVGLSSLIGLTLARECGAKVSTKVMAKAIRYFGKWCGSNLPYGIGSAGGRSGRMDNGMNSEAAVAFHLLGEKEMAGRWARSVCYMWMGRERGHAEAIFSIAWGPIGAAFAPKEEFHMFMNRMLWYYELGRTLDGGFVFMRGSRWPYPADMTAAMALFLYLPDRRLRILGAEKGVFARKPPRALAKAAGLFKEKKWRDMREAVAASSASGTEYAKGLLAAYGLMEKQAVMTLLLVAKSIREGLPGTAKAQLDALARLLGEERPGAAAALRRSLGSDAPRDLRYPKPKLAAFDKAWDRDAGKAGRFGGGFAHSPEYIARTNARGLEGKSPREIARFLAHFNGGPAGGAVAALEAALRKDSADFDKSAGGRRSPLPLLIEELLGDSHPYIRAGALSVLGEIHKFTGDKGDTREATPELRRAMALAGRLIDDPHPEVQRALGGVISKLKVETPEAHRVALGLAAHPDPSVRFSALHMGRYWLKDKATVVRIGILVSKAPEGNNPNHWNWAHMLVQRYKDDPIVREAIPVMAAFTRNKANTVPYRGFFSDGAQYRALEVMAAQWDKEVERMPNVVEALCRCYTRVPYHNYKGWVKTRQMAWDLLEKLGPASARAIRATAAEERKWLAGVDDAFLKVVTESRQKPDETREKCRGYIRQLEELAAGKR